MKTFLMVVFCASVGVAQSASVRESQPAAKTYAVTVSVREGDPIKGTLVKADSDIVVVEQGAAEVRIKTSNVISIVFQQTEPAAAATSVAEPPSKEVLATQKVMSALRRLENAIGVGVMLQNYSALMIESKTVIDENLKDVSDDTVKVIVQQIMNDHQYALSVWNLAAVNGWSYFYTKQEPGRTLVTRYGYPLKVSIWTQVPVMNGLNYVWLAARNRFNELSARVKKTCPSC